MKAIVVTGASSGIGEATVKSLADRGYIAYAGARNDADMERLAALHVNIRPLRIDVTDPESIVAASKKVEQGDVPLDGLVNNAGIAVPGPIEFLPIDELRRQFEVNFFGAVAVTQAFLPLLRRTHGRIVFVGSISGRLAVPFVAPYSASKFALRAIADALRVELVPAGISVSLIEPGAVKTPIWQKGRDQKDELARRLGPTAISIYTGLIETLTRITNSEEKTGMPVEAVSAAIVHALTAPNPHAYYLLGFPARMGSIVAQLPPRLRDRFMRSRMGLP